MLLAPGIRLQCVLAKCCHRWSLSGLLPTHTHCLSLYDSVTETQSHTHTHTLPRKHTRALSQTPSLALDNVLVNAFDGFLVLAMCAAGSLCCSNELSAINHGVVDHLRRVIAHFGNFDAIALFGRSRRNSLCQCQAVLLVKLREELKLIVITGGRGGAGKEGDREREISRAHRTRTVSLPLPLTRSGFCFALFGLNLSVYLYHNQLVLVCCPIVNYALPGSGSVSLFSLPKHKQRRLVGGPKLDIVFFVSVSTEAVFLTKHLLFLTKHLLFPARLFFFRSCLAWARTRVSYVVGCYTLDFGTHDWQVVKVRH